MNHRQDFSPIYFIIYPTQQESVSDSATDALQVMNEDDFEVPSKESLDLINAAPLSFQPGELAGTSIGIPLGIPIGIPVIIADIGIEWGRRLHVDSRDLPVVFVYASTLCGTCLVREKKSWKELFVTVSKEALAVYDQVQSWRVRETPQFYTSFCSTMVAKQKNVMNRAWVMNSWIMTFGISKWKRWGGKR